MYVCVCVSDGGARERVCIRDASRLREPPATGKEQVVSALCKVERAKKKTKKNVRPHAIRTSLVKSYVVTHLLDDRILIPLLVIVCV